MKVTVPSRTLQRIRQVAKDSHSQNVSISIVKGVIKFEICQTKEVIQVKDIKETKENDK